MIAHDTGHSIVPEKAFGFRDWKRMVGILQSASKPCVIHAPSMSNHLCDMEQVDPNVFIVFVVRCPSDIVASENRIGRKKADVIFRMTRRQYRNLVPVPKVASCMARQTYWFCVQRYLIDPSRWVEVQYESLREHPLWIPDEERQHFATHQTIVGKADEFYPKQGYGR